MFVVKRCSDENKPSPPFLPLHPECRQIRLLAISYMGMTQMRKRLLAALTAWLLVAAVVSPPLSAAKENQPAPPKLKVGDTAPDFKLQYFDGNDLKDTTLSQYRGKKNVVLAFYIFAFTGG